MSKNKNYKQYRDKERVKLESEDRRLEREEKELDSYEGSNNEESELNESDDNLDSTVDNKNSEEDEEIENEESEDESEDNNEEDESEDNNEEDESEDNNQEDETEDESKDNQPDDNENLNNVNSDNRRNLGPNRQNEDNESDDKKDKDDNEEKDISDSSIKDKATNELKKKLGNNKAIAKAQELGTKAVATGKSILGAGAFAAKMLVNPIFWAVILILIILASISSTVSVVGGNDYNKACDSNGIGSVNVAGDADDFTRQAAIASWLMSTPFEATGGQPMNKEQAAGVLGNFIQESYGANPKAIQGDAGISAWSTCDNGCVLGWGSVGGKAVGIAQWDRGRRVELVNFAKQEGTEWHDLTTQLKFLKSELDGTYEKNQLLSGGFDSPSKTIGDYTRIWLEKFERAGVGVLPQRIGYAEEFYARYDGSGVSVGSLATQCVGGTGSVDASNLTQLALQIAYTREEKSARMGYGNCGSLTNCGTTFSKPEYIDAKKMAEEQTGADPISGLYASCDRMAATLYRATGIDPNFPWGSTGVQVAYMDNSSNGWTRVSCQERQPGDALAKVGHIMVYIGMVEGRDTIASASIYTRSAHLSDITCKADGKFHADGMSVQGWRKVN